MIDLLRQLETLEGLRMELRSKAAAHNELAEGFAAECRDIENDILELLRQVHDESKPRLAVPLELTPAEKAVYDLLQAGYSHKQIGVRLNIAERTSKFHTKNIYEKLQVPPNERKLGTRAQRVLRFRRASKGL